MELRRSRSWPSEFRDAALFTPRCRWVAPPPPAEAALAAFADGISVATVEGHPAHHHAAIVRLQASVADLQGQLKVALTRIAALEGQMGARAVRTRLDTDFSIEQNYDVALSGVFVAPGDHAAPDASVYSVNQFLVNDGVRDNPLVDDDNTGCVNHFLVTDDVRGDNPDGDDDNKVRAQTAVLASDDHYDSENGAPFCSREYYDARDAGVCQSGDTSDDYHYAYGDGDVDASNGQSAITCDDYDNGIHIDATICDGELTLEQLATVVGNILNDFILAFGYRARDLPTISSKGVGVEAEQRLMLAPGALDPRKAELENIITREVQRIFAEQEEATEPRTYATVAAAAGRHNDAVDDDAY